MRAHKYGRAHGLLFVQFGKPEHCIVNCRTTLLMLLVSCVEGPLSSYLGQSGKLEHCIVSCRTAVLMLLVSCVKGPLGSYLGLSGKPEHCIVSCRMTLLMLLVSCVEGPLGSYLTTCVTCVLYLFFPAEHPNWQGSCYL